MVLGRLVIGLLWSSEKLNDAARDGSAGAVVEFVTKFRTKLSDIVDDPTWMLEYAISAMLDPR